MLYYNAEPDMLNLKDGTIAPIIPVLFDRVIGESLDSRFKVNYPDLYLEYKNAIQTQDLMVGHCILLEKDGKKFIIFPLSDKINSNASSLALTCGITSLERILDAFPDIQLAIPPMVVEGTDLSRQNVVSLLYNKLKDKSNNIFLVEF